MKSFAQGTHGDQAADDGEERRRGKKNAEARARAAYSWAMEESRRERGDLKCKA